MVGGSAALQDRAGFRAQGGSGGGGGSTILTGGVGLPFMSEVGGGPRNERWIMLAPRCGTTRGNRQDGPSGSPACSACAVTAALQRSAVADRSPLRRDDGDNAADHGKGDCGKHDDEDHYPVNGRVALLLIDLDHFPLGGQRAMPCSAGLLPPCAVRHSAFPLLQVPKPSASWLPCCRFARKRPSGQGRSTESDTRRRDRGPVQRGRQPRLPGSPERRRSGTTRPRHAPWRGTTGPMPAPPGRAGRSRRSPVHAPPTLVKDGTARLADRRRRPRRPQSTPPRLRRAGQNGRLPGHRLADSSSGHKDMFM